MNRLTARSNPVRWVHHHFDFKAMLAQNRCDLLYFPLHTWQIAPALSVSAHSDQEGMAGLIGKYFFWVGSSRCSSSKGKKRYKEK